MKVFISAALILLCSAIPAHAQSVSGQAGPGTLRVDGELANIANLSTQNNDNMAQLKNMQTCMDKNMFYAPTAPDADSDGCSKEVDPKIGDANDKLYPNSLCQSTDGKTVTCPTLDQSKILTVMSEAWGTSATRTVSVSCPSGTLRLGCAGARGLDGSGNMVDDCDESTCGLVGVTAISGNGCETTARVDGASADEPVVYATCLSLTGSYSPPPPPPPTPPSACETPKFSGLDMIIGGEPLNGLNGPGAEHQSVNNLSDCEAWASPIWQYYTGNLSPTTFCVQMFEDIDAKIAGQALSGQTINDGNSVRQHWGAFQYAGIQVSDMAAIYTSAPGAAPFPRDGTSPCN